MKAKHFFYAMGQRDESLHMALIACKIIYKMHQWPKWAVYNYYLGRADASGRILLCKPF